MDFEDTTILQMTDPALRAGLFTDDTLSNVIRASYTLPNGQPQAPFSSTFPSLEYGGFGYGASASVHGDVYTSELIQANEIPNTGPAGALRIDVLWKGSIKAQSSFEKAKVEITKQSRLSLDGIDDDIATAGALPVEPHALELARRDELLKRIATLANQLESATSNILDTFLEQAGVKTVSELLASPVSPALLEEIILSFEPVPGTNINAPQEFPIAAAILSRNISIGGFKLVDLLAASKVILEQMRMNGFEPTFDQDLGLTGNPVVIWLVQESWFNDADWPGGVGANDDAKRASRIKMASAWLAKEGIALGVLA